MCAALYTGRSMLRTVVLERGIPGGELLNTEKLDDWIGEKSILGWELAKKFEDHSREFGAEYVTANVTSVRYSATSVYLVCPRIPSYTLNYVAPASGSGRKLPENGDRCGCC